MVTSPSSDTSEQSPKESRQDDRGRRDDRHRRDRDSRDHRDRRNRDRSDERGRKDSRDRSNNRKDGRDRRDRDSRDHRDRRNRDRSDERGRKDSRDRSNDRKDGRDRSGGRPQRGRGRRDGREQNNSFRNRRGYSPYDHKNAKWGKGNDSKTKNEKTKEKEKPNFALSGKLTEETNTYRGVVIKYSEPPEARKPKRRWRLYPFKGEKALQTLYIHRESAYLIGRERKVVDLAVDHPSCSKQHAVLQYRLVPFTRDDGSSGKKVRPYLIDLESANGTFINNKKIDSRKYVELLEKDVIKFGYSSREYVLLHENSKDELDDDDVKDEEVLEPVKKEPKD